ncbi:MAG: glycosyltransferase family 4 protein, partial [Dehalococcoidia bacterium]|nr:glycosyltransferase family 4 protein [Dehalococcoidia bacterium]
LPGPQGRGKLRPPAPGTHMRICEINDIASVASDLAKALRARGHEVELIQPPLFGGKLPAVVKPVIAPFRALEWAHTIRKVRAGRFDAVHIHYAYLGMLGVLGRFPFILHCHGTDVRDATPFTGPLVRKALQGAGHVFYATPDLAALVTPRRPDAEFLPNPVDASVFTPLSAASESDGVLISCALTAIKGAPRILDACERLATARPGLKITAIGGGEFTPEFARLPNVTILPHQRRADLPALIARHGVVIGQVLLGVAGMAEFEALACARPVVCSFTYPEAYEEPPPFAGASTGDEIAALVMRLADDAGLRQSLGHAGREWVRRYHDAGRAAAAVESAARQLMPRR